MSSEATPEQFISKMRQASTYREVFEYGLASMLAKMGPERALAALRDKETDQLEVLACHGLDPQTVFMAGDISTEMIKTILRDGQGVCLVDALSNPGLSNRTSVILSGLRSIVAVPLVHPSKLVIGLLYADNRIRAGAFDASHQDWLQDLADEMVERLVEINRGGAPNLPKAATDKADEGEWNAVRQRGFAAFRAGQLEQAIAELTAACELAVHFGASDPRWGKTVGELAEILRQARKPRESEKHFLQAIDLLEKLGPSSRQELAPVINNLATLYFGYGHGLRAEGLYRRALEIWTGVLSESDRRLAPLYFNLATIRKSAGAVDEARQLFQRALHIAENGWGPDHAHTQRCRAAYEEVK